MAGLLLKLLSFGITSVEPKFDTGYKFPGDLNLAFQIPDRHQQSAFSRIIASRFAQQGNR